MTSESSKFDVSIVIVGLNARQHVLNCIQSIGDATWRTVTHEIIYVDNGSSDGTIAEVRERFSGVHTIENSTNLGYCPAANQGARVANGRYLYFINDDTFVIDDAIALLVEYMDVNPDVATTGSRLVYPDGAEQYSGRRFPNVFSSILGRRSRLAALFPDASPVRDYLCKDELARGEPFDVDWVSAAGQIVRRVDFDAVNGYAEDYYYWHEAVFCDRLLRRGRRVVLHPQSRIVHIEGQGSGPRPLASQRFHIIDFHRGAFRAYREKHDVNVFNPLTWTIGAGLAGRAALLLLGAYGSDFVRDRRAFAASPPRNQSR